MDYCRVCQRYHAEGDPTCILLPPIDFNEIDRCSDCSEKWGFCGYHEEKYGIDYRGQPVEK